MKNSDCLNNDMQVPVHGNSRQEDQAITLSKPARKGHAVCKHSISQLLLRPSLGSMFEQGQAAAHFKDGKGHRLQKIPVQRVLLHEGCTP